MKKPDTRQYSADGHARRMYALKHNQKTGFVAMARTNMRIICDSPSSTESAKALAAQVIGTLGLLHEELKTRVDPPDERQAELPFDTPF